MASTPTRDLPEEFLAATRKSQDNSVLGDVVVGQLVCKQRAGFTAVCKWEINHDGLSRNLPQSESCSYITTKNRVLEKKVRCQIFVCAI